MHTDVRVWRMRISAKHPLLEKPVEIPDLKYVLLSLLPVDQLIYLSQSSPNFKLREERDPMSTWHVYAICCHHSYVPEIHQMSSFPVFKQRKDSNNIFLRRRQRKYHHCLRINASNQIALRKNNSFQLSVNIQFRCKSLDSSIPVLIILYCSK